MKKALRYIFLAILTVIVVAWGSEAFRTHHRVEVGGTTLCIPKQYELHVNLPFLWFADGFDEDAAGGLYLIPAEEIAASVKGFTVSHINQHNVNYKHDITGIIWAKSQLGVPDGLAREAWKVLETEHGTSKHNKSLGLYELGDGRFMHRWWHFAEALPKQNGNVFSKDWYVGHCSGVKPINFRCRRMLEYESVVFDYHIQAQDIPLREEIALFLKSKFESWAENCRS